MSSSFNIELPIITAMLFLAGTAYYVYKYSIIRQNFNSGAMNRQQDRQRSDPPSSETINNSDHHSSNEETLNLVIFYKANRTPFSVRRNESINYLIERIRRDLDIPHDHNISLFCQGRRLEGNKSLNDYSFILNDTILHCFSITGSQSRPQENSYNFDELDENSVHFQTLLFHGMVLVLVIGLIISYKSCKELFTNSALTIMKILIIFWTLAFSKCIAKLIIHKKIVYN